MKEDYIIRIEVFRPFDKASPRGMSEMTGLMFKCIKNAKTRRKILLMETKKAIKAFEEAREKASHKAD